MRHKKTLHQILIATSSITFLTVGMAIGRFIQKDVTFGDTLHDIFAVSPLLILVTAMYFLAIRITKDI